MEKLVRGDPNCKEPLKTKYHRNGDITVYCDKCGHICRFKPKQSKAKKPTNTINKKPTNSIKR